MQYINKNVNDEFFIAALKEYDSTTKQVDTWMAQKLTANELNHEQQKIHLLDQIKRNNNKFYSSTHFNQENNHINNRSEAIQLKDKIYQQYCELCLKQFYQHECYRNMSLQQIIWTYNHQRQKILDFEIISKQLKLTKTKTLKFFINVVKRRQCKEWPESLLQLVKRLCEELPSLTTLQIKKQIQNYIVQDFNQQEYYYEDLYQMIRRYRMVIKYKSQQPDEIMLILNKFQQSIKNVKIEGEGKKQENNHIE